MKRRKEFTIVQLVHLDETGDSCYRMKWPAQNLAVQAPSWRVLNVTADCAHRFDWAIEADLLVTYQSHDADMFEVISERKKRGLKTLVEYNDNFYQPQPWSPIANEWQSPQIWAAYEAFMHMADGLIVTGPGLERLFPSVTSTPIYVLENHLPEAPPSLEELRRKKTVYPSFGWAGSLGHMGDLLASVPVIHEVLKNVPGSRFHVMGNDAIPNLIGVPKDRLVYVPWGSMREYYAFWDKVHVGIAPLLPTPYNECRSDIKALEMSSRGAAPILTHALPYENFALKTHTTLCASFGKIGEAIVTLLKDTKKLSEYVENCYGYVSQNRIQRDRFERLELYEQFLPEDPGSTPWKLNAGYHEVLEPKAPQQKIHTQIEIIKKNKSQTIPVASKFYSENPDNPDALLLVAKAYAGTKISECEKYIIEGRKRYPKDFRFFSLELAVARSYDQVSKAWMEMIDLISKEPESFFKGIEREIASSMLSTIEKFPQAVSFAEEILKFGPNLFSLRAKTASIYEVQGDNVNALKHYERTLQAFIEFKRGGEELANFDRGYLEAWVAALHARVEQGYGTRKKD